MNLQLTVIAIIGGKNITLTVTVGLCFNPNIYIHTYRERERERERERTKSPVLTNGRLRIEESANIPSFNSKGMDNELQLTRLFCKNAMIICT